MILEVLQDSGWQVYGLLEGDDEGYLGFCRSPEALAGGYMGTGRYKVLPYKALKARIGASGPQGPYEALIRPFLIRPLRSL